MKSNLLPSPAPSGALTVRVLSPAEHSWFDSLLAEHLDLGVGRPVGDYLRQVLECNGRTVALLVWGPACSALKDRDQWISWSVTQRLERLKLIVQNRRFLVFGRTTRDCRDRPLCHDAHAAATPPPGIAPQEGHACFLPSARLGRLLSGAHPLGPRGLRSPFE